ncbi:MAG: YCF48-related protein [Ignavibacteria bacterium]|jgi:photosystem II stability/assembly factor-like uncharacterized protein|nr:YCF48-related protein [Ignavibacteria bacterium]
MKRVVSITLVLFAFVGFCYPQSGWFMQYSNTTNHLRDVQFINQQTGWAVGWSNTIRKTTNGGVSWISQSSPGTQNSYQCCYFINDLTGWIGGGSQTQSTSYIFKTTNGGLNWVNQYNSNTGIIFKLSFSGSLNGWASGDYGKILSTTDGGMTWNNQISGVSTPLTSIFFINANTGWTVGDLGVILKTTTGGIVWSPYYSGTTQNLEGLYFMSSMVPVTGYAVGFNGVILKTTDGGLNWVQKPSGSTNWLNSVYFVNGSTGWVSGGNYSGSGEILKTTNGGENWIIQTIPPVSWLADIHFYSGMYGWAVGSNGTIISTVSGGLPVPGAPNLIFPSNNAINLPVNTTFRWSNVTGASNYTFQISTLSSFAVITDSVTVDTNFYNIPVGKLTFALTYFWRVKASNNVGSGPWSSVYMFSTLTGIKPVSNVVPSEFRVYDAYPNPFNPVTKVKFDVPKSSSVRIMIFDITGRQIDNIYNGNLSAGTFEYTWDANKFNSGVYIFRVISNDFTASKKLVLLK